MSAWVNHPGINHGLRALQQRGLVYDVLVFDHQLSSVTEFCARNDAHWLLLDHVGKPAMRDWTRDAEVPGRWAGCIRDAGHVAARGVQAIGSRDRGRLEFARRCASSPLPMAWYMGWRTSGPTPASRCQSKRHFGAAMRSVSTA